MGEPDAGAGSSAHTPTAPPPYDKVRGGHGCGLGDLIESEEIVCVVDIGVHMLSVLRDDPPAV